MLRGIDVSHYQGNIDWHKASKGLAFAFIKATQGTGNTDPAFAANRAGAKAHGLLVGAYHFFTPTSDAVAQAEHFCKVVGSMNGELPPVLDCEQTGDMTKQQYWASIAAWLKFVEEICGRSPIIYANLSYLKDYGLATLHPGSPLWVAQYRRTPPKQPWAFWQYSSNGTVPGIRGRVDLDRFNGDAAVVRKLLVP